MWNSSLSTGADPKGAKGASAPLQKFFKYVTICYKHHEIMFDDV